MNDIEELRSLGEIDGLPIKPCVKSGFCCTKTPCGYGEWNDDRSHCKFLAPANELGQKLCLKYDWIKENVPTWKMYPAFGGGCCMPMFNEMREKVIKKIIERHDQGI